ncbi:sterol desaturase family protein [Mucilaginibacter limnophilus]|uniref:Sterol desaturase family protein n=1 Tax=Mucilaginibacter limnophilus TaxID=1932778 RepID=A0A3S3TGQ5_9SPHI|nr:sterol desaturase family protein [Mucilaginibacter limnophilus]RVU00640.1 sterol desaturase family protein [Mucilaginibacter limnophilus]
MEFNYLAFAVPLFVVLMLLEYYVARKKKMELFDLHRSIANVSIGILERLTDVLVAGVFYFFYHYIQTNFGLFEIKPTAAMWILLFLGTDFIWYWYHRLAHEMNVLWAVHVVHHQSEDFNYTVSARITLFQAIVRTGFWSVLPLLGFPAEMIFVMLLIHGLYPFFVHTQVIGKLGIIEYFMVTPSHHRVHHACNDKYLDKNYGDVLIIWDKLFGTFQKEDEKPVYGLTHQLNTYSFLWQHFHFYIELWLMVKKQKTLKDKFKMIFGSPTLIDPDMRERAEKIFGIKQQEEPLQHRLNNYVIWQVIVMLVLLFVFILFEFEMGASEKFLFTSFTILTLINCGAIMEQKKWVFAVEFLRMLVIGSALWLYNADYQIVTFFILSVIALLVLFYRTVEERYLSVVYPD